MHIELVFYPDSNGISDGRFGPTLLFTFSLTHFYLHHNITVYNTMSHPEDIALRSSGDDFSFPVIYRSPKYRNQNLLRSAVWNASIERAGTGTHLTVGAPGQPQISVTVPSPFVISSITVGTTTSKTQTDLYDGTITRTCSTTATINFLDSPRPLQPIAPVSTKRCGGKLYLNPRIQYLDGKVMGIGVLVVLDALCPYTELSKTPVASMLLRRTRLNTRQEPMGSSTLIRSNISTAQEAPLTPNTPWVLVLVLLQAPVVLRIRLL
ncbi:Protein of unknown function [Pyronema omphalodes CBS 100304]|uniref:Uncharacterized protein n=1 Tax=Pyronema omphalodes (strain CBS 100304) TaxID=1076935 RepID=U4LV66_PYROM|nr:Protein of unknown function [Pyronema omphalodes CBS 100304]